MLYKFGDNTIAHIPDRRLHDCAPFRQEIARLRTIHLHFRVTFANAIFPIYLHIAYYVCAQTIKLYASSKSLSKEYKDPESDIGKWLKTFFGLSYLDSSDVVDCFAFDILPLSSR